ncbi:alpha/beta hydrolase [Amycolatopsis nigrescens]|uniref:alpha/beta hydrolase n=1 Tax=Amycolatopsis nigrescens TaxID=381445 RepID=UPI0003A25EAA|nr:alpha/beta hydrolase [Amycolatopsis nigrescens]
MRLRTIGLISAVSMTGFVPVTAAARDGSAETPRTAATAATSGIVWGECPEFPPPARSSPAAGALECGTLTVPLDYQRPAGETIDIAVSRLRSGDPARRRGVLLVNPGGPGLAGLDLPVSIADRGAPEELLKSYDLIGFDPRGIGRSSPVTCDLAPDQLTTAFGTYAEGPEDVARQAGEADKIAKQCVAKGGDRLPHLTTRNTARDLDRIRDALGEERISYFGTSYGTYLGAVYTELFPQRADRFLLDSAASPRRIWREQFRSWGPGTEIRFPDFGKWAAARHEQYQLGRTTGEVRAKYFELANKLDSTPVDGVNGDVFRQLTRFALYSDAGFAGLAQTWQALAGGNAEALRNAQSGPPAPNDNFVAGYLAVTCSDVSWPRSIEHYQNAVEQDRKRYPMVGGMTANITPCARWPLAPLEEPTEITGKGPRNILLLQNLRDPATIYSGGLELRHQLGTRAKLVTVDKGGHGVYLGEGNACSDRLATSYLVDGRMPDRDRFCATG